MPQLATLQGLVTDIEDLDGQSLPENKTSASTRIVEDGVIGNELC